MLRLVGAVFVLAFIAAACASTADAPEHVATLPPGTIELRYESGVLRVEVARTPDERGIGLSNRTSLESDAGMLFVYESPLRPHFWMRQTLIPLDIIWIGADKRISQIHADVQPEPGVADSELRSYAPDADILYVLELNAGEAAARGIEPGDQLAFDVAAP